MIDPAALTATIPVARPVTSPDTSPSQGDAVNTPDTVRSWYWGTRCSTSESVFTSPQVPLGADARVSAVALPTVAISTTSQRPTSADVPCTTASTARSPV